MGMKKNKQPPHETSPSPRDFRKHYCNILCEVPSFSLLGRTILALLDFHEIRLQPSRVSDTLSFSLEGCFLDPNIRFSSGYKTAKVLWEWEGTI